MYYNDLADAWQCCLAPVEAHSQCCRQRLRYAVVRRTIADEIPLFLAPTIAAYLANEHEITRTQIGIVTVPMPKTTKHSTIRTHAHKGE